MLLGRAGELAALRHALSGRGRVVVVGEAGIGKTTLLRVVADGEERVLAGGGLAMLRWQPYFALERAVGSGLEGRDAAAVAAALGRRVGDGVLLLDDLQWADPDTLAVLPLLPPHVRLLAAARRGDGGTEAAMGAANASGCEIVAVEGLGAHESQELVRFVNEHLAYDQVAHVCRQACGNPLLLTELAREGTRRLSVAVRAQLARTSPPAREAAARCALLGRPADRKVLGDPAAVDELLESGLLASGGGKADLRHDLLRAAVLEGLPPERRSELHSELAAGLDDPGEAARHHEAAGELEQASEKALAAAEAARTPGERARHLALAAACAHGPGLNRLRLEAAGALVDVGEVADADALLKDFSSEDPLQEAEAHLYRARARWALGDSAGFDHELRAGLRLAEGTADGRRCAPSSISASLRWKPACASSTRTVCFGTTPGRPPLSSTQREPGESRRRPASSRGGQGRCWHRPTSLHRTRRLVCATPARHVGSPAPRAMPAASCGVRRSPRWH